MSLKWGYKALFVEMIEGWPEWLSVVPEPAAKRRRRWSEMSSALATYSDLVPLLIASLYRSIAFFMFDTKRLHVSGGVVPSSKKDRGIVAAVGRLNVAPAVKVGAWSIARAEPRVTFALPIAYWPFIESSDGAGEMPSLLNARF